jgi:hypothetical protein
VPIQKRHLLAPGGASRLFVILEMADYACSYKNALALPGTKIYHSWTDTINKAKVRMGQGAECLLDIPKTVNFSIFVAFIMHYYKKNTIRFGGYHEKQMVFSDNCYGIIANGQSGSVIRKLQNWRSRQKWSCKGAKDVESHG